MNAGLDNDLKEIRKAAQRSADLTKQLLTFARKQIISPKQLDLNDTVESMLNMLRRLIGENIDLVWKPVAHPLPVKMDPTQIDQILANLCVNARDAIDKVGKLTMETGRKKFDEKYCKEHPGFITGDFVLLAVSDNLTGCYNRLYISENLDREVNRSCRYQRSLSLAMFDIDQFKIVNDTYGHQCGDRMLEELTNRVKSSTRDKVDWLARYGGDEFLLVMPETDEKQAFHTCQRIRKIVEEMQIEWENSVILITASFGLTGFHTAEAAISVTAEKLIKIADEALYNAKKMGRNRVVANFIKK